MRALLAFALAGLMLTAPGCDSGIGLTVDAAFYVGSWTATGARDGTGDRTGEVNVLLDELAVTFASGGAFTLDADFSAASGQSDFVTTGTYSVPTPTSLVLTADGVAAAFTVTVISVNRIELSAPAAIINAVLGTTGSGLNLTGTVVLTLER